MLEGIPFVDAHVHAARLPTLKSSWKEWADRFGANVPLSELYDEEGTLIPQRFDEYMAAEGVDVAILLWEWGAYFTKEAIEEGLDVKISTWARNAPNTMPSMAKSVANYANSQLIKMEAILEGYAEGIALDTDGNLSEGSGQNIFIVRDGVIHTPPVGSSILSGITRDSVVTIARDMGFDVREQVLPREMLYVADEVFFVGTAVEVTPIKSVDKITIGRGRRGPITEALQQRFFAIVRGDAPDTHGWLQYLETPAATSGGSSRR